MQKSKKKTLLKALTWLVIALPVLLSFLYVRAFGVNVVRWDGWDIVGVLEQSQAGTLGLGDFWHQHVDHRFFFPRIVLLLLVRVTGFNTVAGMYLVLVCLLGTLAILFLAFRSTFRSSALEGLVLFMPVAFLVFSLRQYTNMLTGFQVTFAFGQVFSVLSLYLLLVPAKRAAFPGAMAIATVASFSVVQGLLVWPVGVVGLVLSGARRRAIVWALVGLGEWALYFVGYERRGSLLSFLENPVNGAQYLLLSVGAPLFYRGEISFSGGVLLTLLAGAALFLLYRSGRLREFSFWIALVIFSVLFVASITVGRAALGFEQALESRYTTFSVLGVIGLYAVLAKLALERGRAATALSGILCGLILLSIPVSYHTGIERGAQLETRRERQALTLSTYESQPNEDLRVLHPSPESVRERAPVLQRLDYHVFSA